MKINCDYKYGKKEFYNRVNLLFDRLEEIDGGKFSRNLNEAKDKVDFIYGGYDLRGSIQLQENKVIIEGKIPKHWINLFNINETKARIESNLEYAIKSELKEIFN